MTMTIRMLPRSTLNMRLAPRASVKGSVSVKFPASVSGDSPIDVTNNGGDYAISVDLNELVALIEPLLPTGGLTESSQVEAEAGAITGKYNSPLRTKQAIQGGAFFTQTGTGGAARTLISKLKERVTPEDFGAVGDGVTDDRVAIQNAISRAAGGVVEFGNTTYAVGQSGANAWCLQVTNGASLIGRGILSAIKPLGSVGTGIDTILVKPAASTFFDNMIIANLFLGDNSNGLRNGRHGIHIDTQVAGAVVPKIHIFRNFICTSTAGNAIRHTNNSTNNVNGGMYGAVIRENHGLGGGIYLSQSGDSITIEDNTITGSNAGIYVEQVAGASKVVISKNNITALLGSIVVANSQRFEIVGNNCEILGSTAGGSNGAIFDLNGSVGTLNGGIIFDNVISGSPAAGITSLVRLRNSNGIELRNNSFSSSSTPIYFLDGNGCVKTVIGPQFFATASGGVTFTSMTNTAWLQADAMTAGQLLVGQTDSWPLPKTVSGDATVASSGALTVANDAVTYAKIQNVSAASKLLGRGNSSAGDTEEITLGTGLTMTGTTLSSSGGGGGGGRPLQTGNVTYYVRADGSDSNTGLVDSAIGGFLTIQKAVDTFYTLDGGGFAGTIQVRTGTFGGCVLSGPFIGFSSVTLKGDTTTPTNCVISTTGSTSCVKMNNKAVLALQGFKVQTASGIADAINVNSGSALAINGNMNYGACTQFQISAFDSGSSVLISSSYTISAGAAAHYVAATASSIVVFPTGLTITLTGTPAFAFFAFADRLGLINNFGEAFSGSATGTRFTVSGNAVIFVQGGGVNYFPGNAAGSLSTGGQYF